MQNNLNWENAPDILKPQEAAKILRVGKNKIYQVAKSEGFPRLYVGEKQFLIPKEALRRWVNQKSVE